MDGQPPISATEPLFRCSYDEAELFHLPLVLRATFHDINAGGVDAGVTEDVSQFRYILLHPVERHGEEVAEVMRKNLAAAHAGGVAQPLKLLPDVGAVQRLSVSGDKYGTGSDVRFAAVSEQFLSQILRNQDNAPLALAIHNRASVPEGFHGDEAQFIGLLFADTLWSERTQRICRFQITHTPQGQCLGNCPCGASSQKM